MLDYFKSFVMNRVPGPLNIEMSEITDGTHDIKEFRDESSEVVDSPSQSFNTRLVCRHLHLDWVRLETTAAYRVTHEWNFL